MYVNTLEVLFTSSQMCSILKLRAVRVQDFTFLGWLFIILIRPIKTQQSFLFLGLSHSQGTPRNGRVKFNVIIKIIDCDNFLSLLPFKIEFVASRMEITQGDIQ